MVGRTIRNSLLLRIGLEVGVPDLKGHTGGQLIPTAQLIDQILSHGNNDAFQFFDIGGVAVESTLGRDGFTFGILYDG